LIRNLKVNSRRHFASGLAAPLCSPWSNVTGIFYVNLILLEDARKIFGLFTVISFLLIFSIVNFNKFFMAVKNGYIPSPFEGKKILSGTPYLFLSIFYL
jgi:hypothetical protein